MKKGPAKRQSVKEKEAIFYQTVLGAFTENSMEKDRSLLNLSGGAIALLITLLTTVGVTNWWELILYFCAFLCFVSCIILLLKVFNLNRIYLTQLVKEENADESKLKKHDKAIFNIFMLGLAFTFSIGIWTGVDKLTSREEDMRKTSSLEGISKLKPEDEKFIKSLQGLQSLKPPPTPPTKDTTTDTKTNTGKGGGNKGKK